MWFAVRRRTTTDDVVRYRIEVDVRRRAVCERALTISASQGIPYATGCAVAHTEAGAYKYNQYFIPPWVAQHCYGAQKYRLCADTLLMSHNTSGASAAGDIVLAAAGATSTMAQATSTGLGLG